MSCQSYDSGIGGMQAGEKRSSLNGQFFEGEIRLGDSQRVRPSTSRALHVKRKSCPAVGQSWKMSESMPLNICEAFKGYGICDRPKQLKKPRKETRSKSLITGLEADVEHPPLSHRRIAWGEDGRDTKTKKVNKPCRKGNQLCPE